ncbi:MAG: helix-turn-helix domain-containing protein [Bacilli bacterium]|nr:helix-turn-helix domain-containing protein [Bacilli bacterium]
METIAEEIRRLRKENHLTQATLALYSNTSTKFINQLENGKTTVELDKVERVLAVFNRRLTTALIERD